MAPFRQAMFNPETGWLQSLWVPPDTLKGAASSSHPDTPGKHPTISGHSEHANFHHLLAMNSPDGAM